jgi:hypothetical protein
VRLKRAAIMAAVAALVVILALPGTASAYTTYNNHVLNGGVGNYGSTPRYYYITASADYHEDDIDDAIYTWIHTTSRLGITTPIYWLQTTTQSASVMDFYHNTYYAQDTGIIAVTEHIRNNVVILPTSNNWNWGKIKLNTPCYDPLSDYNEEGSCAHEIGHLMGLGHVTTTSRVMCMLEDGRTVNACQADDANGINYLY